MASVLNVISGIPGAGTVDASQHQNFPQVGNGPITDGRGNKIGQGTNTAAKVTYDIISIGQWGYDEWRTRYDATAQIPGDTYQPDPNDPTARLGGVIYENTGVRDVHCQVKVECFDQSNGKGAWPILERVRTRCGLPTVIDAFRAAGFGIQTIGAASPADYDDDNQRRVSVAFFEIVFNAADSAEDDPQPTIEQVTVPYLPPAFTVST